MRVITAVQALKLQDSLAEISKTEVSNVKEARKLMRKINKASDTLSRMDDILYKEYSNSLYEQ